MQASLVIAENTLRIVDKLLFEYGKHFKNPAELFDGILFFMQILFELSSFDCVSLAVNVEFVACADVVENDRAAAVYRQGK